MHFCKVNRDKGHACFRELVAFGKYGGLGAFLLWTKASLLPPALFSMFIPPPTEYPWNIERAHVVAESLVCLAACAISDPPTLESYRVSSASAAHLRFGSRAQSVVVSVPQTARPSWSHEFSCQSSFLIN
jgi:hypothetical protein